MKKQSNNLSDAALLRQKAEELLRQSNEKPGTMVSESDMLKLIHELEVHQIELELQNEELIAANNKARAATEKFEELYDFAPCGYFTLSRQGDILEMNLRGAQMLGKERSVLINSQFGFFIKEDSRCVFANFLEEIIQGKNNSICDVSLNCKSNSILQVHLTGNMSENREQCHVTATDITERKIAEVDLKKNLAKYKVLIDSFPIGITISDPGGNIVETNNKAMELLGLSREEQLKRKIKVEDWKIIKTDGTIFPRDEFPSVIALNENRIVDNVEMGVVKSAEEVTWINVTAAPIPIEEHGVLIAYTDITERRKSTAALQQIEWMLSAKKIKNEIFAPAYGDLSKLNNNGQIINTVGKQELVQIVSEYLDLLETSSAIYEKNGDYALGLFSSSWCQKMDTASRKLCNAENHTEALHSGKWHCHESCWHDASLKAIGSGKPADVECKGGIRLFAVPIHVNGEVIGAINFGYGEPPKTDVELQELSTLFQVPVDELRIASQEYQIRPQYIIDYAKKRIEISARYIGHLVERKQADILLLQKSEEIEAQNEGLYQANQEVITAREKAEESEKLFKSIIENAPDGVAIVDEYGKFKYGSPTAARLFGYNINEVIGHSGDEYTHPDDLPMVLKTIETIFTDPGQKPTVEYRFKRKNGEFRWIETTFTNLLSDKAINGIILNFTDITERKQMFEELVIAKEKAEAGEERYNLAMKATNDGIFDCNLETNDIYYSPGWKKMLGYEDYELPNDFSVWEKTTDPEDIKKSWELQQKLIAKQIDRFVMEFKMKHKDGHWVDILARAEAFFNERGKAVRIVGTHTDISERKQAEELINQEKLFNEMLIESLPGIFYMFDSNFTPLKWNRNKAELLGLTDEGMKTHNTLDFIATRDKEKVIDTFQKTFSEGASQEIIHIINHEGNEFAYHLTGKRLDTPGGPLLLGVGIDVTDRIKAEKELETALLKAEESDRLKSAFLANMSHEIRTPMSGILGFAELLKEPGLACEEQQKYIEIIEKSGARMLNIINNIVDISKIEAGQMELNIKDSNINEQIEDIYIFFKPEAEAKKIKLSFVNPLPQKEAIIKTDREKLYAILTNLLKNALKYTKEGSIEFGYNLKLGTKPGELEFYVKDTGIGIPENRQEAIFERFIQADISDKTASQGAGLGLAITKAYVEMVGGKIWVDSSADNGSIFYFTLPYNAITVRETINRQLSPSEKYNKVRKLIILIVEDDEVSEKLIEITIRIYGAEILKARTGVEALKVCRENPDIDLILMDIRMPEMNGYEAVRKIREYNNEVIIIAQTAYGLSGDREKAIKSGCNDYIVKPVSKNELLDLIKKYFGE